MNFKTLKQKRMIAVLALLFFLAMPMMVSFAHATTTPTGTISAVQNPGDTTSTWTVTGATFKVDIYISGATPLTVWGWAVNTVTWNPAVVQLTKASSGTFLTSDTGDDIDALGTNSGEWNNAVGTINGGIGGADADYVTPQTSNTAGVLMTLTFTVVGNGNANIYISGGVLEDSSTAYQTGGTPVTTNSANVTVNDSAFQLPEYAFGGLIAIISALAAFIAFAAVKKTIHIPTFSRHI